MLAAEVIGVVGLDFNDENAPKPLRSFVSVAVGFTEALDARFLEDSGDKIEVLLAKLTFGSSFSLLDLEINFKGEGREERFLFKDVAVGW
jgi:hypothetical protein